ncbi:MAG: hypothetical protein EOO11_15650, partial [Chitinophagaceae bacterium]
MNRKTPLIIGIVVVIVVAVIAAGARKDTRSFDERVTLRRDDKIPYGCYAARNLLPALFPNAAVSDDRSAPGTGSAFENGGSGQAV